MKHHEDCDVFQATLHSEGPYGDPSIEPTDYACYCPEPRVFSDDFNVFEAMVINAHRLNEPGFDNVEYIRGQVELIVDSTAWADDYDHDARYGFVWAAIRNPKILKVGGDSDVERVVAHKDETLERRLIVGPIGGLLVIVEVEPGLWLYEDEDEDELEATAPEGRNNEIVMLLELEEGTN